jgi:hypothetical protein
MHSGGQKKARRNDSREERISAARNPAFRFVNFQEVTIHEYRFSTLCLISVPGFLIGLMVGRFVFGRSFREFKKSLGVQDSCWAALFSQFIWQLRPLR